MVFWRYGCGLVYHRQEKYDTAEKHFRQAIAINPSSSVLKCFLGMTLHKLGRNDEALIVLQQAINSDRKNLMAWLEKARVLVYIERDQEALEVLRQATVSPPVFLLLFHVRNLSVLSMCHNPAHEIAGLAYCGCSFAVHSLANPWERVCSLRILSSDNTLAHIATGCTFPCDTKAMMET